MDMVEKQCIHALFAAKDYMELYRTQKPTIDLMLGIQEQWEFEDFLEEEGQSISIVLISMSLPPPEVISDVVIDGTAIGLDIDA